MIRAASHRARLEQKCAHPSDRKQTTLPPRKSPDKLQSDPSGSQSELAQEIIKDPYRFDFLALGPEILERDLERSLIENIRALILELGKGFAFVGSQYHLEVGGQDYYLDLLFYHVVIDLKIEDFKPEFAGKMNFYLSAIDSLLRHANDAPTIGIILCKQRNEMIVEYALRDTAKPMGVARYVVSDALPAPAGERASDGSGTGPRDAISVVAQAQDGNRTVVAHSYRFTRHLFSASR